MDCRAITGLAERMGMMRRGFTLVELLIVITIITIIAGMSMAALLSAAEEGRRARAKSQIAKIDQLISEKWNAYRFRQLPVRIPAGVNYIQTVNGKDTVFTAPFQPGFAARVRLDVMRELQRLELPDRLADVYDAPVAPAMAVQDPFYLSKGGQPIPPQALPSSTRAYQRYFNGTQASTNANYEQAECLYAIISQIRDGEKSALEFFSNSEIGDADGDLAYEILDPWGQPIMFLRWAPGYLSATASDVTPGALIPPAPQPEVVVSTFQRPDGRVKADAFDPLKADPRWQPSDASGFKPFQLRPLIFSSGPDKVYDIYCDDVPASSGGSPIHYNATNPTADPYVVKIAAGNNIWVGTPTDYSGDGLQHGDNITNHGLEFDGE